jgi:hypothetical protein
LADLGGEYPEDVVTFLEKPPAWARDQIALCREDPERHLRSLCSAIANEVFGDPGRRNEVRPVVAYILGLKD